MAFTSRSLCECLWLDFCASGWNKFAFRLSLLCRARAPSPTHLLAVTVNVRLFVRHSFFRHTLWENAVANASNWMDSMDGIYVSKSIDITSKCQFQFPFFCAFHSSFFFFARGSECWWWSPSLSSPFTAVRVISLNTHTHLNAIILLNYSI